MSRRSVVPALLLLSLILTAPRAFAGTYGPVVYAGGSTVNTSTQYTGTQTVPDHLFFQTNPPTWGGTPAVGYGVLTNAQGPFVLSGTANSAGPITATFAWLPATGMTAVTDPPPPVIITETCVASTSILGHWPDGTSAAGSFVNPLGVSGIRYSTQSQAPISTSCEPKVSLTGTGALTATGIHELSGFVSYAVAVSPVTLNLTGPIKDSSGNYNILVGQGCTASLSGIPTGAGWKTTYAWSVSGTTFQSWTVTQNLSATPPTSSAAAVLGPIPSTNPSKWYWNDPIVSPNTATETVTCTAMVTPPVGQGSTFNVSASKKVVVYVPAWQAAGRADYMQVNALKPDDSNPELWAGPTSADRANHLGVGMIWQATVATPTTPAFGNGSLELIQIVTPNDSYTLAPPPQQYNDPLNGVTGLDLTYSYGEVYTEAPNSSFTDNDSPGIPLFGEGKNGTSVAASASFTSKYIDYLMYRPPGSDTQWIALGQYSWSTSGSATIPTTNKWADYAAQHNGSDSAGTISPAGVTMFNGVVGPAFYPTWKVLDVSKHYPAP